MTSIVTTLKGKVLWLEIVLPEKVCGHQRHLCALKQAGLLLAYAKVTTVMPGVLGIIARRSLLAGVLIQTRILQCTNATPIARLKVIGIDVVEFYLYWSIYIVKIYSGSWNFDFFLTNSRAVKVLYSEWTKHLLYGSK